MDTGLLRLAGRSWGDGDGTPILALHGWLDNAATFDRIAPHIPDRRLVALDLPGHGLSGHRQDCLHYHFIDYIPFVFAAADFLGWERFILLGHSLGGGISGIAAGVFPKRVERLILIDALGPLTNEAKEAPDKMANSIRHLKGFRQNRFTVYPSLEKAVEARKKAGDLSVESARILVERGIREVEGGFTWRSDPRLTVPSPLRLTEEQVISFVRRIEAPTLFLRFKDGWPANEEGLKRRLEAFRDIRMEVIPGGHHLHLDNPEPVIAEINGFLP